MKEQKYHLYLSDEEYRRVLQSLFSLKNSLIAQGRYTDAVDDVLCKVLSSKKRKIKICQFYESEESYRRHFHEKPICSLTTERRI